MAILGLDHIIYAAPDLQRAIEQVRALTGVEAVAGGSHPGRGTRNALLSLGTDAYLEILAPDPAQSAEALASAAGRIPTTARITAWAVKCDDLETAVQDARKGGLNLGDVEAMSRKLPAGDELRWRLARGTLPGDGLVPFLLDWGDSPHPALSTPTGCTLRHFRAEHPDPALIKEYLALLNAEDRLEVSRGTQPRLIASLSTPKGEVELT